MWVESEENSYEGSTEEESQILDLGLKPGFGTLPLPNWIKRSSEPRVWSFEDVTSGEKLSRMEVDRNVYATYFRKSEQSICDLEKPLKIQNVKIDPGRMVFKDAYDGKMFKRTLTITNYGKTIVNVRIFSPSSKAFKINPIPLGQTLSSGLSISRQIKYVYTKPTAIPQATMEIRVNNQSVQYDLLVTTCYSQINVTPKQVDFGEIDICIVSEAKKIQITNTGTKQGQFSIDLGRNLLQLIVEPMKGTLQPGETKNIAVEIFGTEKGPFNQEFWIKTEPLQRVHVKGRFIEAGLTVDYPLSDKNLIILNFPRSFVGVEHQRNVIMQNHSCCPAVVCVIGRANKILMQYKDAEKFDANFKHFNISPLEGRLLKDQKFVMGIRYAPQKCHLTSNYYICNVVIDVRKCRVDGGRFKNKSCNVPDEGLLRQPSFIIADTISVVSVTNIKMDKPREITLLPNECVTMVLYGEVEEPHVTVQPEKLTLDELKVYETRVETLIFRNCSKTLPLVLKYSDKVVGVEFDRRTIFLPPEEDVEVTVRVRPTQMGLTTARLLLDLLFQKNTTLIKVKTLTYVVEYSAEYAGDQCKKKQKKPSFLPGITPKNCNEIGYLVDDVRFSTKIQKPKAAIIDKRLVVFNKDNQALIAFPNDRPTKLRPWRNTIPCKTICAQLPRLVTSTDVDYDLTAQQQKLKTETHSYYLQYIRSLPNNKRMLKHEKELEDYVITNQKRVLMEQFRIKKATCPLLVSQPEQNLFVPLTPYQIHDVIVTPKFIQLGKLAGDCQCSDQFTLENRNSIPIHIAVKSFYSSIKIPRNEFVLAEHSQTNIDFTYQSDLGGNHHLPVFIILNFCHVIDLTVLATVVANTVKCRTKELHIVATEKTAFLELFNPLNSDVGFQVDTRYFHLDAFPIKGIIPARKNMIVTITFNPEVGFAPIKEIEVLSESGSKELVEVCFNNKKAPITLSSETLEFQNLPLYTEASRDLIIINTSDQLVTLNVELEQRIPQLTITPTKALIWQKGDLVVSFTVKFEEVLEFTITVSLVFQYEHIKKITLKGNVVFPLVAFKPDFIKFPKIPAGCVVKAPFKLLNDNTNTTNYLQFALSDYPEFTVRNKQGDSVNTTKLVLTPQSKTDLTIEFRPKEAVAYCIYLPYVLNGLVGPPELNCPDSLEGQFYLKNTQTSVGKLKTLKLLCAANQAWLNFDKLEIDLCSTNQKSDSFEITNISNTEQELVLNLDELTWFTICSNSDNQTITINLGVNESWTGLVHLEPQGYGSVTEIIPIFVKTYSETVAYNYITLKGNHQEPQIVSSTKSLYFTPCTPCCREEKCIQIELLQHVCNQTITLTSNCPGIDVIYEGQTSKVKTILNYRIVYNPKADCTVEDVLIFSCSCPATLTLKLYACCDSSLVIHFPSLHLQCSTYPLFPLNSDQSPYAKMMRDVSYIMERWLYAQGYFYQHYYSLPDDIARYPVEVTKEKESNPGRGKKTSPMLPLVRFLINLIDKSILKYIDCSVVPSQDVATLTTYKLVVYQKTLSFLKSQGVWVPGLDPEHLLQPKEYQHFTQINQYDEDTFYRFSKQKWMDLFFHIYKVLVMQRTVDPKSVPQPCGVTSEATKKSMEFLSKDREEFEVYFKSQESRFQDRFTCDAKLLLWIEYHYNRQKSVLWPREKFESVQFFQEFSDFSDSVALATVTLAYCPYLKASLSDLYAFPVNVEQKVHNACRVVQSWKSVKFSFDVHPQMIVQANKVKIILIVTYLYEVLPHFHPSYDVIIEAPLSESSSYNFTVQNCGQVPIQYVPIFFGQGSSLFQLDSEILNIPPGKTKNLKLTYWAKRVLHTQAILVLSGESTGQRYAKSMAVVVTGEPKTTLCDKIKLSVEIYEECKKKIKLKSPYSKTYQAQLFICFEEPESFNDLHAISHLKEQFIPRQIDIAKSECDFTDKGEATITLITVFLQQKEEQFYLYFCNDEVGDFCMHLTLIPTLGKDKITDLAVQALPNIETTICKCKRGFSRSCPRNFVVNLPRKNNFLWKSTTALCNNCFSGDTINLVKDYFGYPIVFRILKIYLETFPQGFMLPSVIFSDNVEYEITPNKQFSFPFPTLPIQDITTDETVSFLLHWDTDQPPTTAILELKSVNQTEIRRFNLMFDQEGDSKNETNDIQSDF